MAFPSVISNVTRLPLESRSTVPATTLLAKCASRYEAAPEGYDTAKVHEQYRGTSAAPTDTASR